MIYSKAHLNQGIMHQDAERVPVQHYARFWRRVRRTIQDEFFLMDQRSMRPGSFAFMCSMAAQQPTVGQGLDVALQFLALAFADKRAVLRTQQSMAAVVLREESPQPSRAFTYFTFLDVRARLDLLAGESAHPLIVSRFSLLRAALRR